MPATKVNIPLLQFLQVRIFKLLKQYFAFGIICSVFYIIISQTSRSIQEPLDEAIIGRLNALLYASGSFEDPKDSLFPVYLWFFPALIVALLATWLTFRPARPSLRAIVAIIFFTSGILLRNYSLPWEIETGLIATVFLMCGRLFNSYEARFDALTKKSPWLLCAATATLGALLAFLSPKIDFRDSAFGTLAYSIPSCVLTQTSLIIISKRLKGSRCAQAVSVASAWIFPLHILFTWPASSAMQRLNSMFGGPAISEFAIPLLTTAVAVACLTFTHSKVSQSRQVQKPKGESHPQERPRTMDREHY